ncbi:MAG: hypothetical protein QF752_06110 [Planctomycetota bacterium]|jgi:hypothetical protein|nr:hypothetical protein [Planctomycetota bacterium]
MSHPKELLGKILVDNNFCLPEQVEEALEYQKSRDLPIGKTLVELGYVLEHQVLQALAIQQDLPLDDLLTLEKGKTAGVPEARPGSRNPANGDDPAAPPKALIFPYHLSLKQAFTWGGLFLLCAGTLSLLSILTSLGGAGRAGLGEHIKNSNPVFFSVCLTLAFLAFVISAYISRSSRIRIDDRGVYQQGIGGWFHPWDDIDSVQFRDSSGVQPTTPARMLLNLNFNLSLFLITRLGPNRQIRARDVEFLQPIMRAIQAGIEHAGLGATPALAGTRTNDDTPTVVDELLSPESEDSTVEGSLSILTNIKSEQPIDKSAGRSCLRVFMGVGVGFLGFLVLALLITLVQTLVQDFFLWVCSRLLDPLSPSALGAMARKLGVPEEIVQLVFYMFLPLVAYYVYLRGSSRSGNKPDP